MAHERRRKLNILVIGNGFDLAHGLPTKYGQFLEWIVAEVEFYHILKMQHSEITNDIKDIQLNIPEKMKGKKVIDARVEHQAELLQCIHKNVWIEYFLQCNMYQKENWVDFEAEILDVIRSLDEDMFMEDRIKYKIGSEVHTLSNEFLKQRYGDHIEVNVRAAHYLGEHCECVTYKDIRDRLECDLRNLIRALEIYLSEYVAGLECKIRLTEAAVLNPDCVLSFNYTDTFEKLYGNADIKYDYIHGKADSAGTAASNNMVLGIDEYLSDDRKNKDVDFIAFKKFYQRIRKETGCKYKDWVDEIRESGKKTEKLLRCEYAAQIPFKKFTDRHDLSIFGHSLDVTDGDILRDLILNDNVYTTIYYLNKDVMGQQIANLVKVIGQEELIRRTGGDTKTIEFKMQQDVVENGKAGTLKAGFCI